MPDDASRTAAIRAASAGRSLLACRGAARRRLRARPASALIELDITQGNIQPLPIAIPTSSAPAATPSSAPTSPASSPPTSSAPACSCRSIRRPSSRRSSTPTQTPRFADWRVDQRPGAGHRRASRARPTAGCAPSSACGTSSPASRSPASSSSPAPDNWRRVAHIIADAIYERLTGEKGYFDTRVVFVDETGPKDKRVKRLAIMDQDGANVRYLTDGNDLVLTPRFTPTRAGDHLHVLSRQDQPRVYLLNIETGQRELVGDFPGMTFAPRFSPDGQQRGHEPRSTSGNANIYAMDLRSQRTTRLTDDAADRHQPVLFARRLADRLRTPTAAARQQLYVMSADGSQSAAHHASARAATATPVWSPRGDLIAFTRQTGGSFAIGVMQPDGSGERILTEGFHNEGPTWAPNGRVLMFFRERPAPTAGRSSGRSTSPATTSTGCRRRASPPTRPGRRCSTERRARR